MSVSVIPESKEQMWHEKVTEVKSWLEVLYSMEFAF